MNGLVPLSGFGDLWLWGDSERWTPRGRDYRLSVRRYPCPECGARPGEACVRRSVGGPLPRLLPHVGRSPPMHSVTALSHGYNDTHAGRGE
jgi:hypothetical protein